MYVATASEMQEIDRLTIEQIGIPGIVLMENAAIRIIEQIERDIGKLANRNIIVFAGKGNNGGDALALSRYLYNRGANVLVILAAEEKSIKGDARINLNIVKNMGIRLVTVEDETYNDKIAACLLMADMVVDGLLGTGVKGEVDARMANIINLINQSGKYITAIDIPSGIDGETGRICGICVKANKTIALGLPKLGVLIGEGAEFAGYVEVVDIGIPSTIIKEKNLNIEITRENKVLTMLPNRTRYSHKGDCGKVLLLAGSTGLTGAAALTSQAALRTGSGLVTLGIPASLNGIMEGKLTEVMTLPLADTGSGSLDAKCIEQLESIIELFDVVAMGPGIGVSEDTARIVKWLVEECPVPLIIDADGINLLSRNIDVLNNNKRPIVLTPHMGEMSRLTGLPVDEIFRNKKEVLRKFSAKWNCIIVLKDWRTLICSPDGHIAINTTGNAGMATGGSGDVLTGIIASLTGQGCLAEIAAVAGIYVHGLAGDIAASQKGQMGMTAGDIVDNIPYALKSIIE